MDNKNIIREKGGVVVGNVTQSLFSFFLFA